MGHPAFAYHAMNARPLWLIASVALNGVLAYGLWTQPKPAPGSNLDPSTSGAAAAVAENRKVAATSAVAPWKTIATAHPRDLPALLESAGIPPRDRAVIERAALVEYQETERARILGARAIDESEYWKSALTMPVDPEIRQQLHALDREAWRLRREIDVRAFRHEPDRIELARRRFGDLALDKLDAIHAASVQSELAQSEILSRTPSRPGYTLNAQETAELESIKQAQVDHARALLTAEEYDEYVLRSGPVANSLRSQLAGFQPSEDEFKAIHALHAGLLATGIEGREVLATAAEQVKALFGEDRYADYLEAMAHGRDQLNLLMARLNLPLRTATTLRTMREDATDRANAIRQDRRLSPHERAAALSGLAEEATHSLITTLGDDGFAAYDELKGEWLRTLRRGQ